MTIVIKAPPFFFKFDKTEFVIKFMIYILVVKQRKKK